MQSAKNRLEMAVSPQAKQTFPPWQPDTDSSTHQTKLTQDQKHTGKCSPRELGAPWLLAHQIKTNGGPQDLSSWNDPSSLYMPASQLQSHQGAARRWSNRIGRQQEGVEKSGSVEGQDET